MENDELDEVQFLIEQGVIGNEQKVAELEKLGWVKVTHEGFNDVCKKFAEEMKEKFPEITESDLCEKVLGVELPSIVRH